jgi:hypothetical protein
MVLRDKSQGITADDKGRSDPRTRIGLKKQQRQSPVTGLRKEVIKDKPKKE